MGKKQRTVEDLSESIVSIQKIICSRCDIDGEIAYIDDTVAAEQFFHQGWRATEVHTYCPECASKYLKS